MKKVLSILLIAAAAANPVFAAETAPEAPAAEGKSWWGSTCEFVSNHKVAISATAVGTVGLALAAWNKKTVSKATVNALAWMKRNKAASIAIIGGVLVASISGYTYANHYDFDKDADDASRWASVKAAFGKTLDDVTGAPKATWEKAKEAGTWANEHKLAAAGYSVAGVTAIAAVVDMAREDSYIKKAATAIYNKLTSKKVEVAS